MANDTTKRCTQCQRILPADLEHFIKRASSKDGLYPWCKECNKKKSSDYYYSHREERLEYARDRLATHNDEINKQRIINRQKNPEPKRKRDREWYHRKKLSFTEEDKKKRVANSRNWRRRFPDKARAIKHRRRALEHAAEGSFTDEDVKLQYRSQRGKCWHCGQLVGDKYHVDHLKPLVRGGSNYPNNIVISCKHCNESKGDKLPHEWNGKLF